MTRSDREAVTVQRVLLVVLDLVVDLYPVAVCFQHVDAALFIHH